MRPRTPSLHSFCVCLGLVAFAAAGACAAPATAAAQAAPAAVAAAEAPPAAPSSAAQTEPEQPAAPKLVELVLTANVGEDPMPQNPLGPSPRNFRQKLLMLRQIATDASVAGVRLKIKGVPDFAHTLDLLEALRAVKAAGKTFVCYSETLDQRSLVFASLADLLVMPPAGAVGLEGLSAEVMYLKDLLAKLHVRFEVLHIGDYKSAFEDLARNTMSAEQREVIGLLLDEFWNQMLGSIAQNRKLPPGVLEGLFEQVLVEPQQALAAGLIDAVDYEEGFDRQVAQLLGGKPELVENYGDKGAEDLEAMLGNPFAAFALLPKLLNPPKLEAPKVPHVAIVYASGPINSGKSKAGWDGQVANMGSDTIVEALEAVLADDNAKAVVLRVNSPGGSALASDQIWGAIQRVKAKKPVIASMGSVAASGGYWISMGCSAIVAQPSTITGSMGVVSMLPDVSAVMPELGINVEVVARGPHGDQLSLLKHGPTPLLKDVITRSMEKVYADFIQKASVGRRMAPARVEELAKGRVWTGRQAEELGLVDELGGLQDSIVLACVMGGGLDPASTPVAEYPQAPNFLDQLKESFEGMVSAGGAWNGAAAELARGLLGDAGLARAVAAVPALRSLMSVADVLAEGASPLSPDRVQCILPFTVNIR